MGSEGFMKIHVICTPMKISEAEESTANTKRVLTPQAQSINGMRMTPMKISEAEESTANTNRLLTPQAQSITGMKMTPMKILATVEDLCATCNGLNIKIVGVMKWKSV